MFRVFQLSRHDEKFSYPTIPLNFFLFPLKQESLGPSFSLHRLMIPYGLQQLYYNYNLSLPIYIVNRDKSTIACRTGSLARANFFDVPRHVKSILHFRSRSIAVVSTVREPLIRNILPDINSLFNICLRKRSSADSVLFSRSFCSSPRIEGTLILVFERNMMRPAGLTV